MPTAKRDSDWCIDAFAWLAGHPRGMVALTALGAAVYALTLGLVGYLAIAVAVVGLVAWAIADLASFKFVVFGRRRPTDPIAALGPGLLLAPARPLPPPAVILPAAGLRAVPVGQIIDAENRPTGEQWTLSPWGTHTLIAGITGAGKSGVFWSLLHGLGHYIQCGMVELYGIDPTGGVEFGMGVDLFTELAWGPDWEVQAAVLLTKLDAKMAARAQLMFGKSRLHIPSTSEPMCLLLVDELAAITGLEAKERNPILKPMKHIMEQGRKFAFPVVGAVQDPRAETIPFRPLFSTFVMLRLPESIIDPICGRGARERGMACDQISPQRPGTAFVLDESLTPVRVRSYWHDDAAVQTMAHRYRKAS